MMPIATPSFLNRLSRPLPARSEIIRDNHEDGERWAKMASKHNRPAHDGVENVSVWETFGFKRGAPTDR